MAGVRLHRTYAVRSAVFVHDMIAAGLALGLGLFLRLGQLPTEGLWLQLPAFMGIAGVAGYLSGLNGGVWRYASLSDIEAVVKTATMTVLAFALGLFLVNRLDQTPRASIVIAWGTMILLLGGSRLLYRQMRSRRSRLTTSPKRNVLLLGSSANAESFIKAVSERSEIPYRIVGLIDDRDRRIGLSIRGCPVLGTPAQLDHVVQKLAMRGIEIDALVLTNPPSPNRDERHFESIDEAAKRNDMKLLRVPDMSNLQVDTAKAAALLPQPVVLEDLLPRRPVLLDKQEVGRLVEGATVLVTGAGGSIGSELCRQLYKLRPRKLILIDSSEFLLYGIDIELKNLGGETVVDARLGNVRNANNMMSLFQEVRPDLVFHAAALKHVPIVEHQPLEGLNTNVLGTRNIADAALAVGAKAMVLISTDKAVNPTNVMGATKRMAESYCQALDVIGKTHFVTVRFGNVLGSAGSVVPLFEKQIRAGGPVTITHAAIERYFMTIPEAAQLVLHATSQGVSREFERGKIFVLDMGQPVKILDVARKMIRLAGFEPDRDIAIKFIGLRPGEKMHEELFRPSEKLAATNVAGVLSASPRRDFDHREIRDMFDLVTTAIETNDRPLAFQIIRKLVPEYAPSTSEALPPAAQILRLPDRREVV